MSYSETFRLNLRRMIKERNWTQRMLAEKSGLNKGSVSRLYSGRNQNPELESIVKIASAFEVRISDMFNKFEV